jgi:hypothetical protein
MKEKVKKDKPVLKELRKIREDLSLDIKDMTPVQLKKYLESKKTLHPAKAWKKQILRAK